MSVTAVPLQPVKRGYILWLWLGLITAVVVAGLLAWQGTRAAVAAHVPDDQPERFLAINAGLPGVQTLESGVQYKLLREGVGPAPNEGDFVIVDVEGRLRDGLVFQPRTTIDQLRVGQFVPGFNEALLRMPKGSRMRVWIPADQGYGDNPPPMSGMTPDSVLVFDIEMLNFISEAELREFQMRQQMMQGGMPDLP
jgi:FKBP-type peptidyl-prolyl cis-trans isomerase FkpA